MHTAKNLNVDEFFVGPVVSGTPELRDQAGRKMPGAADADSHGDLCGK